MDQKVLSFYALRCARGDVMKNAFFQKLLSETYIYISDKSHSWLANSSPLEVTRMRFIIDLTVCKLKLLGGKLLVFGL